MIGHGRFGITIRCRQLAPLTGGWIDDGWVRIVGRRVVAVGRGRPGSAGSRTIDPGDAVVMPGLVNAHTHLEFSGLDAPLEAAGGLPAWIGRVVAWRRAREAAPGAAAARTSAIRSGLAESLAHGVTTIGEIATALPPSLPLPTPRHGSPLARPRLRIFREGLGLAPDAAVSVAGAVARDLDRLAREGWPGGISPHAPYSVTAALARGLATLAVARRLPMAVHLAESEHEAEFLATGRGPLRSMLESLGAWPAAPPALLPAAEWISLMARAPRAVVVHGTHLPADEVAFSRLARHRDRVAVVVCPRTTRSLAGILPPVNAFREAGVRVALGTDGRGSSPDLSVLAECRALVDGGLASPEQALRMATVDGGWALGLEHRVGTVAPGRPAHLLIMRPTTRHADPFSAALDPATVILAAADLTADSCRSASR